MNEESRYTENELRAVMSKYGGWDDSSISKLSESVVKAEIPVTLKNEEFRVRQNSEGTNGEPLKSAGDFGRPMWEPYPPLWEKFKAAQGLPTDLKDPYREGAMRVVNKPGGEIDPETSKPKTIRVFYPKYNGNFCLFSIPRDGKDSRIKPVIDEDDRATAIAYNNGKVEKSFDDDGKEIGRTQDAIPGKQQIQGGTESDLSYRCGGCGAEYDTRKEIDAHVELAKKQDPSVHLASKPSNSLKR